MAEINTVDLHTPPEIARRLEGVGITKATLPIHRSMLLSIAGGAFVALGCLFYQVALAGWQGSYGLGQVFGGLVFNLGLFLVAIAGAELFTGNSLLSIAFATRKISLGRMLSNWALVWLFNGVGALAVVALAFAAQHWTGGGYLVGLNALKVGATKAALPMGVVFARGIVANLLVCLAVWAYTAGRTLIDKLGAMLLPITAFVAIGTEHSIANLFFLPYAIWLKAIPELTTLAGAPVDLLPHLTWLNIGRNLLASTLGNIIGGAIFVGLFYWAAYMWQEPEMSPQRHKKAS